MEIRDSVLAWMQSALSGRRVLTVVYVVFALAAGIQSYVSPDKQFTDGGKYYTCYNNYVIFRNSYTHMAEDRDMYVQYPDEQGDLYKYTPTFALFFGLFAMMPDWLGLCLWNLLNALVLLTAIYRLPGFLVRQKNFMLILLLPELMTSLQNEQSNGLITGLLIHAFVWMEAGRLFPAVMSVVASAFVKLFGIAGLAWLIFYPGRWKSAIYTVLATLLLAAAPLLMTSYDSYASQLRSFGRMLGEDHSASYGYSVMGWLHTWFGLDGGKNLVLAMGGILLLLPFALINKYSIYQYRLLQLCSGLIWIVIFNHKAESPTFVIAMAGVVIWYMTMPKSRTNNILLALALIFTSLSPTDIFPAWVRQNLVIPYTLKAVPCIAIWAKIWYESVFDDLQ